MLELCRSPGWDAKSLSFLQMLSSFHLHPWVHACFPILPRTVPEWQTPTSEYNMKTCGQTMPWNKYFAYQVTSFGEPYDYQSVLHYGAYYSSNNGEKTIVRLDGSDDPLGNKVGYSQIDINKMYNCEIATMTTTVATTTPTTTTKTPLSHTNTTNAHNILTNFLVTQTQGGSPNASPRMLSSAWLYHELKANT